MRHGHAKKRDPSPEYTCWQNMRSRCERPANIQYKNYGARGIRVCDRWKTFDNFILDMGLRPEGTSIDRIKVGLGYFPENCKWSTVSQQQRNRTNNRAITWNSETLLLCEWAQKLDVKINTFFMRLKAWGICERTFRAGDLRAGRKFTKQRVYSKKEI